MRSTNRHSFIRSLKRKGFKEEIVIKIGLYDLVTSTTLESNKSLDKTLAYLAVDFPQPLASLIRTTNLLERFHKEIRRKQRDIGMFQSEQGCEVLWYLVSMRETAKQRAAVQT